MEIMQVHHMLTDCWRLYKEYYSNELTDREFEQVYEEAGILSEKYENNSFANAVIVAVVNELGEIWKRKHESNTGR